MCVTLRKRSCKKAKKFLVVYVSIVTSYLIAVVTAIKKFSLCLIMDLHLGKKLWL